MAEPYYQYFSNQLSEENANQPIILAKFYSAALGVALNQSIIKVCSKLKKMYGAYVVFNAIVQVYDMEEVTNINNGAYGILCYFCKKEVAQNASKQGKLLSTLANENEVRLQQLKESQLDIPDPFIIDDEENVSDG